MRLVLLGLLAGLLGPAAAVTTNPLHWVDAWSAAPDSSGPPLSSQTVRQIVRMSLGGNVVRVRLSNLYGSASITLGPVHIALHGMGPSIVPASDHTLLFDGKPSVTIAKGESVLSDALVMQTQPLQELAVSLYVPANIAASASTIHSAGLATAFITERGDATSALQFSSDATNGSRYFLNDIEVATSAIRQTVVCFGDSITDGIGSSMDANQRWPDVLASRLQADPKRSSIAVADAGIGGNRILNENFGPSALSRFNRDALDKPGVRWIVLLEGINDIGDADTSMVAKDQVTTQQIIDGMKMLIARAHARHIKIYGGTLTPFSGAAYYKVAGEEKREAVNAWIRSSGAFDGVVDFDKAIRDPAHPQQMLAAYDSGDHLHPNSSGYQAMAKAINLNLFASVP